ncbi:hypothetical protein [Marinilabilia rubra]|uniref:Uncharacterized protein n=1 Tax=Marinilabilia rubra TaxID=2162893 RepID=A0A2U2B8S0_9BACT|nr:hypothetical protein [Marinilabilia rubra]PWD99469.1 hypothetical protein DDZ16_10710 [Marinilabilia rubra]
MGTLLYKALLIKEFFYGLLIKGMAGLIVFIEAEHIPKNWFYLAAIIIALFPLSTYILKEIKAYSHQAPGFGLVVISMLKMLLIPVLIILFFEKEHEDIEVFVIPSVVAYLVLLFMDTKWKIKWLFLRKY